MFKKIKKFFGTDWEYFEIKGEGLRKNSKGLIQGFCCDHCKWYDLDFLQGTTHDQGFWINFYI